MNLCASSPPPPPPTLYLHYPSSKCPVTYTPVGEILDWLLGKTTSSEIYMHIMLVVRQWYGGGKEDTRRRKRLVRTNFWVI
ncbi:unnamed protein product [Allacma fusca]|uniref:Uncharacterized protein n=1 Tax=Allacma fusca TaxID=39272 RepID=A0A8J2LFZ0_9HEXA|nr:unnamed protein product [Allacma fusca]